MVVVLTIENIRYFVVTLFDILVGPFLFAFAILSSLAALFALIPP